MRVVCANGTGFWHKGALIGVYLAYTSHTVVECRLEATLTRL
jgi:hypothetical protein